MARKLYLYRIQHEFVVCADDQDEANDIAEEALEEEVDLLEAKVVREVTSVAELGGSRHEVPYGNEFSRGGDGRTCEEILDADDDE